MKYLMLLAALLVAGLQLEALAGDCCGNCGCHDRCNKVCRVVCEMKAVKEVKYKVLCEDFCVPGPSEKCGCKWIPGCADIFTRKKLVKYEETKMVPHYKWVVQDLCAGCAAACGDAVAPAPADLPPMPPAPAPVKATSTSYAP